MGYQNVSTPRIFLNIPDYMATTGQAIDNIYKTLPVGNHLFSDYSVDNYTSEVSIPSNILGSKCFIAILGHTFNTDVLDYIIRINGSDNPSMVEIINGSTSSGNDGFSISSFTTEDASSISVGLSGDDDKINNTKIGSIVTGIYYDFHHSPDLSLTLSYQYEGIKEITTKGGSTLTNQYYSKPPKWGNLGAWELGGNPVYSKSGRRIWDLSFSYISDSDIFPDNAGLANETIDTDTVLSGMPDKTLLEDDTFFRLIHLTNAGQLPFIFQPDNTSDENSPKPDQLSIAKFDNNFSFKQVANNVYNFRLKIREVW